MPRPNPPRKRPRKRPAANPNAARADAALTKQTAQSTQPKNAVTQQQKPSGTGRSGGAAAAAAPDPDEPWAKRSYAILIVVIALVQLPVTAIQWAFAPAATSGVPKGPVYAALAVLNPISLLIASLFAAPIAKLLAGERRSLRFMETIFVAIIAYFVWLILAVAAGALLTAGTTSSSGSGGTVTPCPASATNCSTPQPTATPAPTPTPTAAPSGAASASASPGTITNPGGLASNTPVVYATFAIIDTVSFLATFYIYPPLYRRLRVRRPPPARGGGRPGGAKS